MFSRIKRQRRFFYYLLVKKQSFRDTLVNLLWGSVEEEVAKKSLRNAVYVINKAFGEEVLVSPKRAVIMLNPAHRYDTDLDSFVNETECGELRNYSEEFLEGFLVKDADSFDKWMVTSRNQYRDLFINKLQRQIQKCIKDKQPDQVELLCKELIAVDEFNEKAYRVLMNLYRRLGQYDKSIEVFNNLSSLLRRELSITPDGKTNELLGEIVKEKAARQADMKSDEDEYFYGRRQELQYLNENFLRFTGNSRGKSILILGEAGLGKTTLVEKHLRCMETDKIIVLKTNCYQVEENYLLKPWNDILHQLSQAVERENIELPAVLQRIVNHVFPGFAVKKVADRKKTVIVFDDIQWIDSMSLSLIRELLMENRNQAISFIVTSRAGYDSRVDRFIADMKVYGLMETIELNRFNRIETIEFASGMVPELAIDEELGDSIYKETEGNTFFIVELLNNLKHHEAPHAFSPKMQDILRSRFLNVSEEGRKLLNITSVFFDRVTMEELLQVSGKNELELLDVIGELEEKNLLKEDGDTKNVGFAFTHKKLREFVYSQLTVSKKKILHIRIARLLESRLRGSKHEIFPVFYDDSATENGFIKISEEQIGTDFNKISELIKEIKEEEGCDKELEHLELSFMHMVGRGFIRSGDYRKGLSIIEQMIRNAVKSGENDFALKGYKQMIYFCINTFNTQLMESYIEEAIKIAEKCGLD